MIKSAHNCIDFATTRITVSFHTQLLAILARLNNREVRLLWSFPLTIDNEISNLGRARA
jgi:hypothetical protein